MSAVGDSEVISHEAPTDWIRPPKLENRLATQSARKMRYLNGVRADARRISGRGGESFMAEENAARFGHSGHGMTRIAPLLPRGEKGDYPSARACFRRRGGPGATAGS